MGNLNTWIGNAKSVLVRETETLTYDADGNVIERRVEKEYETVREPYQAPQPYPYYPTITYGGDIQKQF